MPVTVRFFAAARSAAGVGEVLLESGTLQPGTLESLTAELTRLHPDLEPVLPRCSFLLNGTAVHGAWASIDVNEGDEVDVLPPFAGG